MPWFCGAETWCRLLCFSCVIIFFKLTGSNGTVGETHCKTQNLTNNVVSFCSNHATSGDKVYIDFIKPEPSPKHPGTCSCTILAISPSQTHVSVAFVGSWIGQKQIVNINDMQFENGITFQINATNSAIVSYRHDPDEKIPNICFTFTADYSIRVECLPFGSTTTKKTTSTSTGSPTTTSVSSTPVVSPTMPTKVSAPSSDGSPLSDKTGSQTSGDGDNGIDIALVAGCSAAGVVVITVIIIIIICCRCRRKKARKADAAKDRSPAKVDKEEEEMYMTENEMYVSADLPDDVNNDATARLSNPYDECS